MSNHTTNLSNLNENLFVFVMVLIFIILAILIRYICIRCERSSTNNKDKIMEINKNVIVNQKPFGD